MGIIKGCIKEKECVFIWNKNNLLSFLSSIFLFSHLTLVSNAYAAPQGGQVVGGIGHIHQNNLNTRINQQSQNMVINWQSYNVEQNERVQYVQPNSRAIALNRILGNNASTIRGQIDANGQVILVNPNGIFFSATSVINVGGLMASGLDIKPDDFMNGNYIFNEVAGTEGFVINSGIINAATGGNVTLLGKQVKNDGMIVARLGAVNMAAGKAAVVTFDNAGLLGVRVTEDVLQNELGVDPAVLNSGTINAEGGRILLTASTSQDIFSRAVNTGDMEQATSAVVNADGTFTLGGGADVVNTGTLDVSTNTANQAAGNIVVIGENVTSSGVIKADAENGNGGNIELHATDTTLLTENSQTTARASASGNGGNIKVLGNNVGLFDNAQVDASGANGGGTVLIGGDRTGQNNQIRNAEFIYLGENTQVNTDATNNGNGGKLITFASDTARIYGRLSARGGVNGGDGGFIETSGLRGFEITSAPDIAAPMGQGGQWLIDPYNIDIVAGGNSVTSNVDSSFTSTGNSATLGVDLITQALGSGDVIITTGLGGPETGDITFRTTLDYRRNRDSTLTLNAANNIDTTDQDIRADRGGNQRRLNLVLNANADNRGGGDVIITNSRIYTNGGDFTATGVNFSLSQTVDRNNNQIRTGNNDGNASGNVSITTTGRALVAPETADHPASISIGADIITDGGTVTLVSNQGAATTGGDVSITSSGRIYTTDNIGDTSTPGTVSITADGTVQIDGDITTDNSSVTVVRSASLNSTSTGFIDTTDGGNGGGTNGDINLTSAGVINIGGALETRRGSVSTSSATFSSTSSGNIDTTKNGGGSAGTVSITTNGTTTTASSISVGGNITTQNADVALAANQGAFTSEGSVALNSSGSISTQNGAVTASGATFNGNAGSIINAGSGQINLGGISGTVNLGNTITTGDLTALGVGTVTQNSGDSVQVGGRTDIRTTSTVTLDNATNNFNRVDVDATSVTLRDNNNIQLGNINITGTGTGNTLTVTSVNGEITQAGDSVITNDTAGAITQLTANNAITLKGANNNFDQVTASGASLGITDIDALNIGNVTLTGTNAITMDIDANGLVQQVANTSITNNGTGAITDINNTGNVVTLANAGNDFNQLNLMAASATIVDTNALVLGNTTLTGTGDNFSVTTGGSLTQVGGGTGIQNNADGAVTNITATGQAVILNNTNNDFAQVDISASTAQVTDTNSIVLGATDISGNTLAITARNNGDITQAGGTVIDATAAVANFTAMGNAVTLFNSGNDFNIIALNVGRALIRDINTTILGDITTTSSDPATSLYISSSGTITQQANTRIEASGIALFIGRGLITLANNDNDFEQVVALGSNLDIQDRNELVLGTLLLSGTLGTTLNINTNGTISQAAANSTLQSNGNTNINAGNGGIDLNSANNTFGGTVSLNNTGNNNISIRDSNSLNIATSNIGRGSFTANALGITQNGVITQESGAGSTTFNAGAGVINLNSNNQFTGSVSLNNSGANNVAVRDVDGIQLGTSNIGTGTFTVNANGISQSGAITQAANAGNVTLNGGASDIVLNNNANEFVGSVALSTASNATIADISNIDFSTSTIGGDLTATAGTGSDITQNGGALAVTGNASFNVDGGRSITLLNTANNFNGLSFNAKAGTGTQLRDVRIANSSGLDLQTLNLTGDLVVTAVGDITNNSGSMVVAGDTRLDAGAANDITLTQGSNDFSNIVIANANNVNIRDINGINIGDAAGTPSNITGNLTVGAGDTMTQTTALTMSAGTTAAFTTTGGNINLSNADNNFVNIALNTAGNADVNDTAGIVIGASSVQGNLTINTTGNITQAAALTNGSTASFNAGNGTITLTDAANDFNVIETNTRGNVNVTDTNGIQLGNVTATSDLTINAGGDITEAANGSRVTSSGLTTLTSTGAIQLGSGAHDFNNLVFNGSNVAINDVNGINIGGNGSASAATGTLSLTANGNISDNNSSAVTVSGTATFDAGTGNITLANTDFQGTLSVTAANNITVNDATALQLGNLTAANSIDLTAATSISGGTLSAPRVALLASNGINATTATAALDVQNIDQGNTLASGDVTINNNQTVDIIRLHSYTGAQGGSNGTAVGDVTLNNSADVTVSAGSIDTGYNNPGGVSQSSPGPTFTMELTGGGSLRARANSAGDINNADITAYYAVFTIFPGDFGWPGRQLILNLNNGGFISANRSVYPRLTPPGPTNEFQDLSKIPFNFFDVGSALAGEQLIKVEALEDIDPAIFSDVRNYTYGQIAIRLPRDQLFEDELQELEEQNK